MLVVIIVITVFASVIPNQNHDGINRVTENGKIFYKMNKSLL